MKIKDSENEKMICIKIKKGKMHKGCKNCIHSKPHECKRPWANPQIDIDCVGAYCVGVETGRGWWRFKKYTEKKRMKEVSHGNKKRKRCRN